MANVNATVKIPEFNRNNIQVYVNELQKWKIVTEVLENQPFLKNFALTVGNTDSKQMKVKL